MEPGTAASESGTASVESVAATFELVATVVEKLLQRLQISNANAIVFLRRKERWPKVKLRNPFIIIQCTSGCLINSGVSRLLGVIGWAGGMEGKQREIGGAEGTGRGIVGGQQGHAGYSAYPHGDVCGCSGHEGNGDGNQNDQYAPSQMS